MVEEKLLFLKPTDEDEGKKRGGTGKHSTPFWHLFTLLSQLQQSSSSPPPLPQRLNKKKKEEDFCGRDTGSDQLEQQVLDSVQALAGLPQGSVRVQLSSQEKQLSVLGH